jgi:hypothetical protein
MPTLYGESYRAFRRLREEILRSSNDHSIFDRQGKILTAGMLAESPDGFVHSSHWASGSFHFFMKKFSISKPKPHFEVTNFGLRLQLPMAPIPNFRGYYVAFMPNQLA